MRAALPLSATQGRVPPGGVSGGFAPGAPARRMTCHAAP
jgi:hypothetical protein